MLFLIPMHSSFLYQEDLSIIYIQAKPSHLVFGHCPDLLALPLLVSELLPSYRALLCTHPAHLFCKFIETV